MNFLSLIGTGAAFLNYKKAKQEYETVKGEIDSIEKALYTATAEREAQEAEDREIQKELDKIQLENVDNPQALHVSTVCKVANLVGKYAKARVQLVISNSSDKTYYIVNPSVICSVFGKPIVSTDLATDGDSSEDAKIKSVTNDYGLNIPEALRNIGIAVKPGEVKIIDFPKQIIYPDALEAGIMDRLRNIICYACNKRLITSCYKINITDYWEPEEKKRYSNLETANIFFYWTTDIKLLAGLKSTGVHKSDFKIAMYRNMQGVLRYCMELSLIGE